MKARACCPTCGRSIQATKSAAPLASTADTSTMTHSELFTFYKRTAPLEDIRFLLRTDLSPELRARVDACLKPTTKDARAIFDAWRAERLARDTAAKIPAIGSPAWVEALKPAELEQSA